MSVGKGLLGGGVVFLLSVVACAAPGDSSPGDKAPAAPRRSRAGLTRPWNELKDLTDDEKTKIIEIHRKAVDQVHEIEAKEHADVLAMLSDQQKKEVAEIEAKDRQATRERRRPATQPSASATGSNTSEK